MKHCVHLTDASHLIAEQQSPLRQIQEKMTEQTGNTIIDDIQGCDPPGIYIQGPQQLLPG